jgi:hypothetical protein
MPWPRFDSDTSRIQVRRLNISGVQRDKNVLGIHSQYVINSINNILYTPSSESIATLFQHSHTLSI